MVQFFLKTAGVQKALALLPHNSRAIPMDGIATNVRLHSAGSIIWSNSIYQFKQLCWYQYYAPSKKLGIAGDTNHRYNI
jgi:hypothetical protein